MRLLFQLVVRVRDELVPARELCGDLAAELVEVAEVGREVRVHARDLLIDPEVVVEAVEPGAVLHDRPAEVGVAFPEEDVRIAREVARFEFTVHVVADERFMLVVAVHETAELVAAALHRHHHHRTRSLHLNVRSGGRGGELLDRVVVEVEAGAAFALGGVHTVGEDPVLTSDPEALVAGLLALVAAAHVVAAHPDARGLGEHGPDIGCRGDFVEGLGAEVRRQRRRAHIHDRRFAGDRDCFGDGGDFEGHRDGDGPVSFDDDALTQEGLESGNLEPEVVGAAAERSEPVGTVAQGYRLLFDDEGRAREGDGGSGDCKAL